MKTPFLHWPTMPTPTNEAFLAISIPEDVLVIIFDQVVNQSQSVRDISSILLTCHQWKYIFEKKPCISLVQALFQLQNHHQSVIKFPQECLTKNEQNKNFTSQELKLIDRVHSRIGFENLLMVDSKLFHPKSLFLSLLDRYSWNPEVCKKSANENIQFVAKEQLSILNSLIFDTDDQRLNVIKHDFIEKFYLGSIQNKSYGDETWMQVEKSIISTLKKFPNFNDKKFFIKFAKCFGSSVFNINEDFKKDREIVLTVVQQNGMALQFANESLKKDREIVLAAIKKNGDALAYADKSFKKDREIVLAAIKQHGWAFVYADESLKKDREIVLAAVTQAGHTLQRIDESFKKDQEIVLAAVKQDGRALDCADKSLTKDQEVVLAAVKQDGRALQYADESLRNDREVVLAAVKQRGGALKYANENLKKDRAFVLLAVQQRGCALEYADESFKKDRAFVLLAVQQRGCALEYADESLRKDREIVLAAVKQNSRAIHYADKNLQKDQEIVLAASQQDGKALQ